MGVQRRLIAETFEDADEAAIYHVHGEGIGDYTGLGARMLNEFRHGRPETFEVSWWHSESQADDDHYRNVT